MSFFFYCDFNLILLFHFFLLIRFYWLVRECYGNRSLVTSAPRPALPALPACRVPSLFILVIYICSSSSLYIFIYVFFFLYFNILDQHRDEIIYKHQKVVVNNYSNQYNAIVSRQTPFRLWAWLSIQRCQRLT